MGSDMSPPDKDILVIDDEPSVVAYLMTLLEDAGYSVRTATSANEAYEMAMDVTPALICMDIMMPKRSGITLYRDLKTTLETRRTPVLFVTALSRETILHDPAFREWVSSGDVPAPEGYIEKPIDVGQFLQTVESIMEQPASSADAGGGGEP